MLKGLIFMKSLGRQEDVLLTPYLSLIHDVLPFVEGASELTVTSDRICFDSLPPQYSAHEGFFLLSGNKPIPGHTGHKLQNLSAPDIRRGFALSALASVCLLVRC